MWNRNHFALGLSWSTGLLACVLAIPIVCAQTGGPYDLSWATIDGGVPATATGGDYSLDGSLGQPDAGRQSGGNYIITGGFWNVAAVTVVGVADQRSSDGATLSLGAPNPFTTRTVFRFAVARPKRIELTVFDLRGARVRTLLDEALVAGRHTTSWDGRDDLGKRVPNGVYLVRLAGAGVSETGKVVLLHN